MSGQRRIRRRVEVDDGFMAELISKTNEPQPLSVVNLSTTGTALLAGRPLARVDEDLVIKLSPSVIEPAMSFRCRICYIIGERQRADLESPRWLHGAEFQGLGQAERLFVERYVEERSE